MNGKRRQWILLGGLLIAVFAYFRYGGGASSSTSGPDGVLAPIDADGLVRALKGVSTVDPALMVPQPGDSNPDRNLFQFGAYKPPPPPPMTEAERLAAENTLREQEKAAREAKEQQAQVAQAQAAEAEKRAAEQQLQQQLQEEAARNAPPVPPGPVKPVRPPPPPINFKYMGVMGSDKKKLGVFIEGERMLLARKGEVFDSKYRVIDIRAEWADVGYVDPQYRDQKVRIQFGQGQ